MQDFHTQQNYMMKKKATQSMRMQDFQAQQKPHVAKVWENADEALLVRLKVYKLQIFATVLDQKRDFLLTMETVYSMSLYIRYFQQLLWQEISTIDG